jgi:NAD(P)-dependent dehydrogenase (short-subunit alcohol dehydrogenase family)
MASVRHRRKESDRDKLRNNFGTDVYPVLMDVEHASSISSAAREIESQLSGRGLDGLVNVAGIGMVRPIEYAPMQDFRQIFEVNFFGQVATIQAFLGSLRKSRGRVVNITTVGVNLALPFGGLLNASKSAFAKISDTLRLEMRLFGVRVSAIEPGAIATPAVDKTLGDLEQVLRNLPPEAVALYGAMIRDMGRRGYEMEKNGIAPDVVAAAVHQALTANRPRIRYRVGKHAKLLSTLPKILPERVMDALLLRMFGISGRSWTQKDESVKPRGIPAGRLRGVNPN